MIANQRFIATEQNCKCDRKSCPPQHVLDRIADLKFSGGYNRKNKTCPKHHIKMSVTNICSMCE